MNIPRLEHADQHRSCPPCPGNARLVLGQLLAELSDCSSNLLSVTRTDAMYRLQRDVHPHSSGVPYCATRWTAGQPRAFHGRE